VTISPVPDKPSPIYKVDIVAADGTAVPASMSEDVPVDFVANSDIYGEKPVQEWQGQPMTNAEWTSTPVVTNWFFDDVAKNKSTQASVNEAMAPNRMRVVPIDPCAQGAVTVHISRQVRYQDAKGQVHTVWSNGGRSLQTRVSDITPPLVGLAVQVEGGKGSVWAVENPPNEYPLPKHADIHVQGDVFSQAPEGIEKIVAGLELNNKMELPAGEVTLYLPKTKEVSLEAIVKDNDQVEPTAIVYGLCEVSNGVPRLVGEQNPTKFTASKLDLPKQVHLYIEAKDLSGNHAMLFIPVVFR
jgi:hypothetical protein